jgi:hypothetical protein
MGLKSLFSKEGRHGRALQKAIAKAQNPKIKPDDRRPSLHLLAQEQSAESTLGLLARLNFNYDINMVSDEEEKQYVFEVLVARGVAILPEIETYLESAPTLSWGLRILEEICEPSVIFDLVAKALTRHEPGYERDPTRKQQLLTFIGELGDERASEAIAPFLDDHDETVRFICVEALVKLGNEEIAREPLLKLLIDEDEESLRIKNRIADGLIETSWSARGYRGTVERMLASMGGEYVLDGKGKVRKKKGRG